MIPLWHLDVKLVVYKEPGGAGVAKAGVELVRVTHRTDGSFFSGKAFRDLDSKALLGSAEISERSAAFVHHQLGFGFPFPLGPRALCRILRAEAFPSFEEWEKFLGEGYYSREAYYHDVGVFHEAQRAYRDHECLWNYLRSVAKKLTKPGASLQDRATYAREIVRSYPLRKKELDDFLGTEDIGERGAEALQALKRLSASYVPEFKPSKKKMLRAPDNLETGQSDRKILRSKKIISASGSKQTDWI